VADLVWSDCRACHAKGQATSLAGKLPLSHVHQLSGINCEKCHGDLKKPGHVPFDICTGCHDMAELGAATVQVKPANPHESPHYGEYSDCNLCHHQHRKSENNCLQCHSFNFKPS